MRTLRLGRLSRAPTLLPVHISTLTDKNQQQKHDVSDFIRFLSDSNVVSNWRKHRCIFHRHIRRLALYFAPDECLNIHDFISITDARALIEAWRQDYNRRRPHLALGHLTPSEYPQRDRAHDPKVANLHF
jgi:transposase InsO family protein